MITMTEVKYRCTKSSCGAEDTVALFPHEAAPPAINCFKCHAGFRVEISEMLARRIGMFPNVEVVGQRKN